MRNTTRRGDGQQEQHVHAAPSEPDYVPKAATAADYTRRAARQKREKSLMIKNGALAKPRRKASTKRSRRAALASEIAAEVAEYAAWGDEVDEEWLPDDAVPYSGPYGIFFNGRWTGEGIRLE